MGRKFLWHEDNIQIVVDYWGKEDLSTIALRINKNQKKRIEKGDTCISICGLGSVAYRAWLEGLCTEEERDAAINDARKRKPITPRMRENVLKRDKHRCLKCGRTKDLQIDHIVPVRLGGETKYSNLQTLCRKHNREKGGWWIVDYRYGRVEDKGHFLFDEAPT